MTSPSNQTHYPPSKSVQLTHTPLTPSPKSTGVVARRQQDSAPHRSPHPSRAVGSGVDVPKRSHSVCGGPWHFFRRTLPRLPQQSRLAFTVKEPLQGGRLETVVPPPLATHATEPRVPTAIVTVPPQGRALEGLRTSVAVVPPTQGAEVPVQQLRAVQVAGLSKASSQLKPLRSPLGLTTKPPHAPSLTPKSALNSGPTSVRQVTTQVRTNTQPSSAPLGRP